MAQPEEAGQGRPIAASDEASLPEGYLDIYKQTVEMADRISARRAIASSFFLTVQSGLVALLAFVEGQRWSIALAGIVLSSAWWLLLRSYRQLNAAKFKVIHTMEERLPLAPYADEWAILDRKDVPLKERYAALGLIEQTVPVVFLVINVISLAWDLN
jgi:hypothetical protein